MRQNNTLSRRVRLASSWDNPQFTCTAQRMEQQKAPFTAKSTSCLYPAPPIEVGAGNSRPVAVALSGRLTSS